MLGLFNNFDVYAFSLRIEAALSTKPGAVFAEKNLKTEDLEVLEMLMPETFILYMHVKRGWSTKTLVAAGVNPVSAFNAVRSFFTWVKRVDPRGWDEEGKELMAWANDMRSQLIEREKVEIEPLEL